MKGVKYVAAGALCAALAAGVAHGRPTTKVSPRVAAEPAVQSQPEGVPLCTRTVGILGDYFRLDIETFLTAQGHIVVNITQADIQAGILSTLDVLYVNRNGTTDAAREAVAIEAWVRAGGVLLTEFSATEQLFDGATYGFFGPATLDNGFSVPSGDVGGFNDMDVVLPDNVLASGLPATWCSGDPLGVFTVYNEFTLDPAVKVFVRVDADTNEDGFNDAAVGSACIDDGAIVIFFSDFADWSALAVCPDYGRRVEEETLLNNAVCLALDKCLPENRCFHQPPNRISGYISDKDCDICGAAGVQVLAENMVLSETRAFVRVRFWGGYYPNNTLPFADRFTVAFWTDAAGQPGSIITKAGPLPSTRFLTGNTVFGVDVYEYAIDLVPSVVLDPGTYWVEIYNDTDECPWDCVDDDGLVGIGEFLTVIGLWGAVGPDEPCDFDGDGLIGINEFLKVLGVWGPCPVGPSDDWLWESGDLDPVNGLPNAAFASNRDNQETWTVFSDDLSLNLECNPFGCPGEGDCNISNGTPGCDNVECCRLVCEIDPFCCDVTWDGICAGEAQKFPQCNPSGCSNDPDNGSCCEPNGTPYCDNVECCRRVCGIDPFCCDISWDQICVDEAFTFPQCECGCVNDCGIGNLAENEICPGDGYLDPVNGGCNSTPPVFGTAVCGDTICGTSSTYNKSTRDTDWYFVALPDPDGDGVEELRARLTSEFDGVCFIIDVDDPGGACVPTVVGTTGSSVACDPTGDAFACLPAPGEYVVFVATAGFSGFPCSDGLNDYTVTITCNPCPPGAMPSPVLDPETSAKLLAHTNQE